MCRVRGRKLQVCALGFPVGLQRAHEFEGLQWSEAAATVELVVPISEPADNISRQRLVKYNGSHKTLFDGGPHELRVWPSL
eukprot:2506088-Pyramimonas_sp.AAC.1